ncbi:MAG TPA: TlpA disulfide reductase family protein [Dissulfurispiraceae bacterium]|nr:TlpA disulfide reductase family protein [Dissulfurispiraceae bacterium]
MNVKAGIRLILLILCAAVVACSCAKQEEQGASPSGPAELNRLAPSFSLTDVEGKKVNLSDYKGKVVMLEFFTSWCGPCQLAAPEIETIHEQYRDKGLVVLGISMDVGANAKNAITSFRKEHSLSYPVLMDTGDVSRLYGVFTIPTSFVIDKKGILKKKHMGFAPSLTQEMTKEIEALL